MRPILYALSFLAVMLLAFWAYRENYTTQSALRDVAHPSQVTAESRPTRIVRAGHSSAPGSPTRNVLPK